VEKNLLNNFKEVIFKIATIFAFIPVIASILAPMFLFFGPIIYFSYYLFFHYPQADVVNLYTSYFNGPLLYTLELATFLIGFGLFVSGFGIMVKKLRGNPHSIVTTGIYKYCRHPQNVGILLMIVPFCLYNPWFANREIGFSDIGIRLGDLFSFSLCFLFIGLTSLVEEHTMLSKFPAEYMKYLNESRLPLIFKGKRKLIRYNPEKKGRYFLMKSFVLVCFAGLLAFFFYWVYIYYLGESHAVLLKFPPPSFNRSWEDMRFTQKIPFIVLISLIGLTILRYVLKGVYKFFKKHIDEEVLPPK
jgi:protein-S-isoprenylcysteine O-methyltransferase Ste14